ncbi:hypothetical protein KPH14_007593 [Odynerus spinipes]|uniref:Uncharacterized protein n=1 Tax=Odynerus spinipes TaxID=1348599 RepID=A0AAD9RHU8_9HYME|nr:hypothetical protein KPH14_007593 [Odynerus spinipes]
MMMMAMLMLAKMKIIGVIGMMAMKGMIMGAMSLMISTVMLMMKFLKGGGPWQSGGGGGGGGGSQIKEVVLLAKIPNGGGGGGYGGNGNGGGGGGGNGGYGGNGNGYGNGGCCNGNGGDSYSPPSPSYGVPSGGGGGGGYGGGWGRSFSSRVVLPHLEASRNNKSMVRNKIPLMIGESIDNRASPNYEDYQDSNVNLTSSRVDLKSLNYTMSPNYRNINGSINTNSTELLNSTSVDTNGKLERAESFYDLNVLRPVYINEWQAVENANAFNEKANQE